LAIRILAADDFAPWPRFISSIIAKHADWRIVGEAADGFEAVRKAGELKPDVILLDVGLPLLDGIEAARQIRTLVPESKILFFSGFDDPDIVREALRTGASGYVAKLDAESELTKAIEAVLRGEQYVSRTAKERIPGEADDSPTSNGPIRKEDIASSAPDLQRESENNRYHEVQFYSNDALLLARVTCIVEAALMAENAAIVIATKRHRDDLFRELKMKGLDVDAVIQRGAFVSLDAAEVLSTFMVNGRPDPIRFFEAFDKLIASVTKAAKAEHPRVAVFGEGVALLWAEGNPDGAIQLEKLGNDLAKIHKVDIFCAYPFTLHIQEDRDAFKAVCAEHSAVYVG
jgi:DNA-binding NarL/FixJ family response regulator